MPAGLNKRIGEIPELLIRKDGDDAWFFGSALLFANDFTLPVIGNSRINQFLDTARISFFFSDWSSHSLSIPIRPPRGFPSLGLHYRIAGPVLGQLSATTANVQSRVEREGRYRLVATEVGGQVVFDDSRVLSPTAIFRMTELNPNTHYAFRLSFLQGSQETPLPDGDGEFRTFPPGRCRRTCHVRIRGRARETGSTKSSPPGSR